MRQRHKPQNLVCEVTAIRPKVTMLTYMFCVLLVAAKDPASSRQFSSQVRGLPLLYYHYPPLSCAPTWGWLYNYCFCRSLSSFWVDRQHLGVIRIVLNVLVLPLWPNTLEHKDVLDKYLYKFSVLTGSVNPNHIMSPDIIRLESFLLEPLLVLVTTQIRNPAFLLSCKLFDFSWSWKMT